MQLFGRIVLGVVFGLFIPMAATAAQTPVQKCQAAKNKAAGKYCHCRQNAEAKLASTGDTLKYNAAITLCNQKVQAAWQLANTKAAAAASTCLDAPLTEAEFEGVITLHCTNIATALSGGGLSFPGERQKTGQTQCDQGGGTLGTCPGSPAGQDAAFAKGLSRSYTDNGDGTISDNATGLMWEKLSDDATIHEYTDTYDWSTAFSTKIATLNSNNFAGHNDWRLPNVNELQSLTDYGRANPSIDPAFNTSCAASCTVTTCSCTKSDYYWSSTSYQDFPAVAWLVDFANGFVTAVGKSATYPVRAVRSDF